MNRDQPPILGGGSIHVARFWERTCQHDAGWVSRYDLCGTTKKRPTRCGRPRRPSKGETHFGDSLLPVVPKAKGMPKPVATGKPRG